MDIQSRTRTRLSPIKRQQQLLDIGVSVFAQRGIGRGGHADIAEIANVSVATVFNYFPTREHLVEAILNHVEQHFDAFIHSHLHSHNSVKSNLNILNLALIDLVLSESPWLKIWFEWSTSTQAGIWDHFVDSHTRHQKTFRALFLSGMHNGEIASHYSPSNIAKLYHGSCYALYTQANRRPDKQYLLKLNQDFLSMLAIFK